MHPLDTPGLGEIRVSPDQMQAIASLYATNPSLQAARTILLGQLLSSGIVIRRGGKDVELKETFAKHLECAMPLDSHTAESVIVCSVVHAGRNGCRLRERSRTPS